jgi:hypothetical protein
MTGRPRSSSATRYNSRLKEQEIPTGRETPPREEKPMLYCPVCSTRLTERKCKLLCEKCGYYMSCADYY